MEININNVVMIKGDGKNRRKWKIGIVENIFMGKDNKIRSIRIHTGKNVIEIPLQLLYPIELLTVTQKQLPATLKLIKH